MANVRLVIHVINRSSNIVGLVPSCCHGHHPSLQPGDGRSESGGSGGVGVGEKAYGGANVTTETAWKHGGSGGEGPCRDRREGLCQ